MKPMHFRMSGELIKLKLIASWKTDTSANNLIVDKSDVCNTVHEYVIETPKSNAFGRLKCSK